MYNKERRGVSPVIAVLLMIAIAISIGVLVYVWVSGLAGSLTSSGGTQVAERLELVAYRFDTSGNGNLTLWIKNTGGSQVTVREVYIIGGSNVYNQTHVNPTTISPGDTEQISISPLIGTFTDGTAYTVRVVTESGSVFSWSLVAGRSG